VRDRVLSTRLAIVAVTREAVLQELSTDHVLLADWKNQVSAFVHETVLQSTYSLILASNPTRFSSSSIFRGLGFLTTFVGRESSRLNQSENSDLFEKSFSSASVIMRAANIS